jgi:hypothetical protein
VDEREARGAAELIDDVREDEVWLDTWLVGPSFNSGATEGRTIDVVADVQRERDVLERGAEPGICCDT